MAMCRLYSKRTDSLCRLYSKWTVLSAEPLSHRDLYPSTCSVSRDVYGTGEQEWMMKNHLMLPSPNGADLNEKNFVTTKKGGFQSKKEYLFLQSLQTWRSNSEPGSNPEHNAVVPLKGGPVPSPGHNLPPSPSHKPVSTFSEKNFASSELRSQHVLLPSLQKGGSVTSPRPNRGHNSINPPPPNPSHNHPVSTFSEKNFASSELRNQHVLLPSLLKVGPVTPPGPQSRKQSAPSPSHNPVSTFSEKNFASFGLRSQHVLLPSLQKGPATSPGPNPGHHSISSIHHKNFAGCNMRTKKNFADRKMASAHPPSISSGGLVASLKATS
ncbi:PREDICTED: uncharacterized protein LOC109184637 [Ipomoea nil]|uniref:uncharacterized protein LOC109184637 n=1 Tax=Ipomoea nil TaxID=35883 RepID=UPI00090186E0|nr:PREDICTED: uncharacterized protein LOC109184637 [Ipomoea nil]